MFTPVIRLLIFICGCLLAALAVPCQVFANESDSRGKLHLLPPLLYHFERGWPTTPRPRPLHIIDDRNQVGSTESSSIVPETPERTHNSYYGYRHFPIDCYSPSMFKPSSNKGKGQEDELPGPTVYQPGGSSWQQRTGDISVQLIATKEPTAPKTFPPLPEKLDLLVELEHSQTSTNPRSLYIPGDTKSSPSATLQPLSVASTDVSAFEHNSKGEMFGRKGKWVEAANEHRLALQKDPQNLSFRASLANTELKVGWQLEKNEETKQAIEHYTAALYTDPLNGAASNGLDRCLRQLALDPDDPGTRRKLADEADQIGNPERAIVEYRNLVTLDNRGLSYALLGMSLIKADKVVDGYVALKIAVEKPDWTSEESKQLSICHRQLADLLRKYAGTARESGRHTTAKKRMLNAWIEYRRAAFLDPDQCQSMAEQMMSLAKEAVSIKPSYNNYLALGSVSLFTADIDLASKCYDTCAKLDENNQSLPLARAALQDYKNRHKSN